MFGKKKKKEFNDSFTLDTRNALVVELAEITASIEAYEDSIGTSFQARVAGEKHGGAHDIDSDWATMRIDQLKKKRAELLAWIDRINTGMAAAALHDHDI